MAKPRGRVVDHHGEPPGSSWPVSARGSAGWERPWAISEGPWPISEGSWTWLIARCWRSSWIQRAPQLVQMAVGYRPKPIVTRADRHNGQRGIRTSLTSLVLSLVRLVASRTGGGAPLELTRWWPVRWALGLGWWPPPWRARGVAGARRPCSTQLGVVSSLLAAGMVAGPGRTWMRLGLASSILGTRICSTPLSNEASICSAWTWAGRVIERRKAP